MAWNPLTNDMKGQFIISFDCEGKWGMADHITPEIDRKLTTEALQGAYARLADILAKHDIKATFAFVGLFTLSPEQAAPYIEALPRVVVGKKHWLGRMLEDFARGVHDGWFAPKALEGIQAAGCHEIATHGFSHVPLAREIVTRDQFRQELSLACQVAASQGWKPRTIIYPRNQVGYPEDLVAHGIVGYRECIWPDRKGVARQLSYLAAELGLVSGAQVPRGGCAPVPIPPGHILNFWHNRVRRMISRRRTVERWKGMIDDAIAGGSVAHLWTHPHNFISDPGLFAVLDEILGHVRLRRDEGKLDNPTQIGHVAASLGLTAS